uniref:Reverse transcriptase domain-containing protein n=1 Tax=Clytia hemisphaerica TaxID=252671 RepID=A0A7M5VFX3_9CNID
MNYLESNHLLAPNQYGYRSKRSTELATAYFCDSIRREIDNGKLTGAIFVDLSKAFDTIGHSTIIDKLSSFGINGLAKDWISSYLFGRHQRVRYNGSLSPPSQIFCGVPQGSILGPLLFLLIFNDSTKSITTCKMMMYADDTVIFYSDKNIARIHENLQSDFNSFVTWLEHNELIINTKIGKTETMLFGTGKRISMTEDTSLSIKHKENIINQTNSYKYLGLSLSNTLCMAQHITSSIKVASSRLNLLKKMRAFMHTETAIVIYRSMILPFLTNCNFATFGATPNYLKERIVLQE